MTNLDCILKIRDITLSRKVRLVKAMAFPVVMYGCELDYKESWAWKNWCFWTVVLEKALESPLDCKEIQPVHPKGDQSWIFIGRTDAEAETPVLWPPDLKNWLIWKEEEMVGWHHWLSGPESALGVSSGSWWWTGKPGMLQSLRSERVGHDWATELN